tara:strand:- start:48 stop:686 length:639 start_codon:yes stop_codon:yes gene_type:complete
MIKKFETKPQTIFAPKGVYYIFEDKLNLDFDKIKTVILKKEKEIIKKYPSSSDGDTGLGDSLTSRHPYFNLFDWPEMSNLKKSVRLSHDNFLKELDQNINIKIYSQCWANVMRKNQKINKHSHYNNDYCYLGGHICVQSNDTSTHYVDPYTKKVYSSKNEVGKITLFPNWIEHYTDRVTDNKLRITIAFDMVNEIGFVEDIYDNMKHHWIEL